VHELVVRSVPSDSPDDWRALQDLREMKDDALEKKYGLNLKRHINDFVVITQAVSHDKYCMCWHMCIRMQVC
jgi:hypothetical protein